MKIKRGDQVYVRTGVSIGTGKVLKVFPGGERIIVSGVNIIKRHTKPNQKQQQGGIIEKEASIHISKVMLVCPKCGELTRIAAKFLEDGKKVRACKRCGEVVD